MKAFVTVLLVCFLFISGCDNPVETKEDDLEIIDVTFPNENTVWVEFQTETTCNWNGAIGETVYIKIYKGNNYQSFFHQETANDGQCTRNEALGNWGTGNDFRLKVIDSQENFGWSDYFTITEAGTEIIEVIYPNENTQWIEYQTNTYCDWENATGDNVYIEIYKGAIYQGLYHDETANDGQCTRNEALGNWGTGNDFRLKVIDANDKIGWSDYFTIQALNESINITFPISTTNWLEYQIKTSCDWINATGDSVRIEIFQEDTYLGEYHSWTTNDGHCNRDEALEDWGTGNDFRLKMIDANGNEGWSDFFTINTLNLPIIILYPNNTTYWQQFEEDTYCEWNYATGAWVYIEIYKGNVLKGLYHDETANDGFCRHNGPLDDWGTGTDFRLRLIDANDNEGWSDYFTIE